MRIKNLAEEYLNTTIIYKFEEDIKFKANKVSKILIESFFNTLNAPLKAVEQKMINDEQIIQNQLSSFEKNDENRASIAINIHKKIKNLDATSKNIKGLN